MCSVMSDSFCNPMDYESARFLYEIFQARILEWVAISSSRASFRPRDGWNLCLLHCMQVDAPLNHQGSPRLGGQVGMGANNKKNVPLLSTDWIKNIDRLVPV